MIVNKDVDIYKPVITGKHSEKRKETTTNWYQSNINTKIYATWGPSFYI